MLPDEVPEKYILARWRKDVPRKHTRVKVAYHDPGDMDTVSRFNKMMEKFEPLCETASLVNDQTVNMVIEALSKLQIAINECKEKKSKEHVPVVSTLSSAAEEGTISSVRNPVPSTSEHQDPCPSAIEPVIKDPIIKKRKRGMPKASRHKTLAETGYKKTTNKKKLQNNGAESDVEDDRHATKGKKAPEEKDTTKGGVGKSKGKKAPKEKDTTNGGVGKSSRVNRKGKAQGEKETTKRVASRGKGDALQGQGKGNSQRSTMKAKGKAIAMKGKSIPIKGVATKNSRKQPVKEKRLDELMA